MKTLTLGTPETSVVNWEERINVFFPNVFSDVVRLTAQKKPKIDILVFDGGEDVNPAMYGEERHPKCGYPNRERDTLEANIFHYYFGRVPICAVCRGHQFVNVMMGGALHQDLYSMELGHDNPHDIVFFNGFAKSLRPIKKVNSYHHQAVKRVGEGMHVVARHPNGIIEATESEEDMVRTVQWHPEYYGMPENDILTLDYLFFRDFFGTEGP